MVDPADERKAAIKRLEDRREFRTHVVVYIVVNLGLVAIWAASGGGYFWPVWVIGGWGIGLVLHAWSVYGERAITEDEIQEEMRRRRGEGPPD